MQKNNPPSWFNSEEYAKFLAESSILFEMVESKRSPIKAEKQRMRPEVDPSDRERDRKQESRHQDKQKSPLSQILIVKNNNSNKVEIILRTDFDKSLHSVIKGRIGKIDKGDVNQRDLTHYSGMENFINTKTSIKLIGKIEKEGGEKKKKEKKDDSNPDSSTSDIMPPPPHARSPKDGKEITNAFSTYPDWDHTSDQVGAILPDALNTLSGKNPPIEYQQAIDSSRTLGDSIQRIVNELQKDFPEAATMTYSVAEPLYPTGKMWASMNLPEAAPNVSLIGTNGESYMGIAVKIGEQIRPMLKGEAAMVYNAAISGVDQNELTLLFNAFMKEFIESLKTDYSQASYTNTQISSNFTDQGREIITKRNDQRNSIITRQSNLVQLVGDMVEDFSNEYKELKQAFIQEAFTGNNKFDGGMGSAQVMLCSIKDGTEAKFIPLTPEYAKEFSDSDDTDLRFKFTATPNSSNGFFQNLMQKVSQINEGALDFIADIEGIKNQITSPQIFLQMFELEISDVVFKTPLIYSDFYIGDSDGSNIVTILGGREQPQKISIPVKTNFDPDGTAEEVIEKGADALLESYLLSNDYFVQEINNGNMSYSEAVIRINEQFNLVEEKKRNYRREYDNYQGKPEQRANRSKRVLARRKMIKKGKARKGDGKDINHKDGNPQNNSMNNLESMSASKNRAMHEDHGAGFEGTPELVEILSNNTPHSINPAKKCHKCKKYSEIRKKKKKK